MVGLKFPIVELEKNKFQVVVDMTLYAKETLVATCYKFTGRYYVYQISDGNFVRVILESKDSNIISEDNVKQFCNELIDQQVRYNTNKQFGHIRDLIVEEAFKPVNQ